MNSNNNNVAVRGWNNGKFTWNESLYLNPAAALNYPDTFKDGEFCYILHLHLILYIFECTLQAHMLLNFTKLNP